MSDDLEYFAQAVCVDVVRSRKEVRLVFRIHGSFDSLPETTQTKPFFVVLLNKADFPVCGPEEFNRRLNAYRPGGLCVFHASAEEALAASFNDPTTYRWCNQAEGDADHD